ncbi:tRNA (guanosine(46)-N7)-methyltransferase TrmB [Liquorilactobacillus satsumensis]|uniref:tRNA (guanine-N(7)-)-methyltransferase n=1 Tax=Liquorilactobacillus satsumensis DSM 16230 = JCM 12392 TaxID=1423801 RepID=A0A0R1V2H4_9LACO|nr:tRNA (guanosine(46)-N7)-methyltransferase TrmB [Liquorilactobacillus satsumensis]KRL99823.1 tRNA (m(7)G46) methyltransferase [Liquorilactobacillus satsumensis DSM 16230 = JCM 12392]MCC7665687.1 tRNA (guanosine(46)-N7)-methyltransferase TrmB [Liquorilactobacillus satsumensis]MCP9311899.1 tRNA (guanosine(46)-N7)-methyltransferase TrmB [Liquorilactobacillus satsumensis]MCP9328301.1 tRNA (guanosine(46)-N7)-methyltransferase TrmB [Liquorilactobacillus satsumensis]MCP9356520.1 tRNA (guanosine(46)
MRLRNKPWAEPLIKANPEWIVTDPEKYQGKWQERFPKVAPLYIEVGMGKGGFVLAMAQKYPERNFVGIELQTTIAAIALKKQLELKLPNLQLLRANGGELSEYFAANEVSGIYLNFSDPWPKKRQAKRRLTYPTFLKQYAQVMQADGLLEFKTDNRGLFEYSLVTMNNYGMDFAGVYLDLHQDLEKNAENVMTEYEEKFSQKGQPIYKVEAAFTKASH